MNQTIDNKNRNNNYLWSYYLCKLKLNNDLFLFEFNVISKSNGENHYRVQRAEKKIIIFKTICQPSQKTLKLLQMQR